MKKILYTTLILLVASFAANAQSSEKGIHIKNLSTEITGDDINIYFTIKASQIEIKCNGYLKLEFAIESADRRLVLPAVIYTGAMRYRYERREATLSNAYCVEPYHIYKGVKKNESYGLEYWVSIPYYSWMEHAEVTYREYMHDCSGDYQSGNGLLVADINPAPAYIEPEIWRPDSTLFPRLVNFLVPEVENIKARASMLSLNIGFPVNVTQVRPDFGNNRHEIGRADSLVRALTGNELLDIRGVAIKGYASPEGSYTANERLARGRSQNFKQYLVNSYPSNAYIRNAYTSWVPEDWDGFGRMVENSDNITEKQEVLAIVYDETIAPDTKDKMLQNIKGWSNNYKIILQDMYPKLRRIELTVDYTIRNLTDSEARELLYTDPSMLSLNEIFRVANYYEPGSKQYREVYEIAARQYPNDVIANTNAAAALLQEGNAEAALPYLMKTEKNPASLINFGAYWYIMEDLEKSMEYFNRAKEAGIEQADYNLRLITPAQ